MKRPRSKISRGLVTKTIAYRNRRCPHDQPQALKVDVRQGEAIDDDHAAAMVAVRTSLRLADVEIVRVVGPDE